MTRRPSPPKIKKLSAAKQRLMDQLLERNSEGTITPAARKKLEALVAEAEQLMVDNARRLAQFSENETVGAPVSAVPVTIWVKPDTVER